MTPDATSAAAWLAEREIDVVTTQAVTLSGAVVGKHLSAKKLVAALGGGHSLTDTVPITDYAGLPAFGWPFGPWQGELRDIRLRPDAASLVVEPSLDGYAAVIGTFRDAAAEPLPICCRSLLERQVARLAGLGLRATVAVEVEATVFRESFADAKRMAYQGLTPLGGDPPLLCDAAPPGELAEYTLAVRRHLDAQSVEVESWSMESGAGAIELNLAPADPVAAADAVLRTKLAMRRVAEELGSSVTFMAKCDEHQAGSGFHINHALSRAEENAFSSEPDLLLQWVGGLLATARPAVSLLLPNVNSFRRLEEGHGAPTRALWGADNKSVLVRVAGDASAPRVEHRLPGSDANVYVALAAVLAGGIAGLDERLEPPDPFEGLGWCLPAGIAELPGSVVEAAAELARDVRLREALGEWFVDYWVGSRRWEWYAFHTLGGDPDRITAWELARYFERT